MTKKILEIGSVDEDGEGVKTRNVRNKETISTGHRKLTYLAGIFVHVGRIEMHNRSSASSRHRVLQEAFLHANP